MHKTHIRLLRKMIENMFFLDTEHVGMGRMPPLPKKKITIYIEWEETTSNGGNSSQLPPKIILVGSTIKGAA